MIVPTFFWCNRDDASTAVTWAEKGKVGSNKRSIATITAGCHLQTYGVQGNKVHWTEPPTKKQRTKAVPPLSKDDHRLAQSLRSTNRFQLRHHAVLAASHPAIKSVGDPTDYNFKIRLGDRTEKNALMGTAIRPNEESAKGNAEARGYFTPLLLEKVRGDNHSTSEEEDTAESQDETGLNDPIQDRFLFVATAKFSAPAEIYCNYPLGQDRYLKIPHAPHLFFSSGAGLRHLHRERISPIVYLTDPKVPHELAKQVHYGFLMEHSGTNGAPRPVFPGRVFSAAAVYSQLGLAVGMTDSQVWDTDPDLLTGLFITKMYKSEYPENVANGRGPLLEYRRLISGRPRLGFWTAGGGGAGELIGQTGPNLDKASSLEAAILEHPQKVASARNQALLCAAQRKAWVQVYLKVGPTMVPEIEVDYRHFLSKALEKSSMSKAVYLGIYEIYKVTYEDHDINDLERHLTFQEGLPVDSEFKVPSIDNEFKRYSRFRTQMHYQFHLKPIEVNDGDTGTDWRYLRVSRSDPRRIQVLIPKDVPINTSLSFGKDSISVDQVYEQWVNKDKLFVNFLSLRDSDGDCPADDKTVPKGDGDDEEEEVSPDLEDGE